jgi:hypothetical protein
VAASALVIELEVLARDDKGSSVPALGSLMLLGDCGSANTASRAPAWGELRGSGNIWAVEVESLAAATAEIR